MYLRFVARGIPVILIAASCTDAGITVDSPLVVEPSFTTHSDGHCVPWPECGRSPHSEEVASISRAIDGVRGDGCDEMADVLEDWFNGGWIDMYDEDDGRWGDIHGYSLSQPGIHLWSGTINADEVENTLRHEYGHWHEDTDDEGTADGYMETCEGLETRCGRPVPHVDVQRPR